MDTLLQNQETLHTDAVALLEETLLPLLSKYGKVEVNGSYTYKLLYHPDIDLYIINNNLTKENYVSLCAELLSLDRVSKIRTGDRVNFPQDAGNGRPTGYWVSPTIHTADHTWSCDIWMQKPEWVNPKIYRYDNVLANLPDEQRLAILTLKQELITAGRYGVGKEFESVNIYDAVLTNTDLSLDELRKLFN